MLSLGLLVPFGAGSPVQKIAQTAAAFAEPGTPKRITLVRDGLSETIETRADTAQELLAEHHVIRAPEDSLSVAPDSRLANGETVVYREAVPVTVVVDGRQRAVRTAAATVGDLLEREHVSFDGHDVVSPTPAAPLANDTVVTVKHVDAWSETVLRPVPPATVKRWAFNLPPGRSAVVSPGSAGLAETSYVVRRTPGRTGVRRTPFVSRILRAPRSRIVAEGIGEYTAISALAKRGIDGTLRLASSALSMVATAYTGQCPGCSGTTAIGRPAGRGIIAVDPRVIPLGTRVYIPGYGPAIAGDTGGEIRGRRVDLGFDSRTQAAGFGRRDVMVYLIK